MAEHQKNENGDQVEAHTSKMESSNETSAPGKVPNPLVTEPPPPHIHQGQIAGYLISLIQHGMDLTDEQFRCLAQFVNPNIWAQLQQQRQEAEKAAAGKEGLSPPSANRFHIDLKSEELQRRCKGLPLDGDVGFNILGCNAPPPVPPEPPKVNPSKTPLYPKLLKFKSLLLRNEYDVRSSFLPLFCEKRDIGIVQNLPEFAGMNMKVFTSDYLAEANPDHEIEIRVQNVQNGHENRDSAGNKTWLYESATFIPQKRKKTRENTIAGYADYQKNVKIDKNSDKPQEIMFGTNIDLNDEEKWEPQLRELEKLPEIFRIRSEKNMLSHVGHRIDGMNTPQVYMKVTGSRTPAHQENLNMCSVNINIGPGDCEWIAVETKYWGALAKLCEEKQIDFLSGSWWPDLEELAAAGIPVFKFIQKPGDLVWVNMGCVHWVQALGTCNNVAWNVGPMNAKQYQIGTERFEWNKVQKFRSLVPMVTLSWNLAEKVAIRDWKLYKLIKTTLMTSLIHCFKVEEFLRDKGKPIEFHGKEENEYTNYCEECKEEVFNYLFALERSGKNFVHCVRCALKLRPGLSGFDCLQEHKLENLMKIYDEFAIWID